MDLEYKVQYSENDYAFVCRVLEEAGIAFTVPDATLVGEYVLLADRLDRSKARAGFVPYVDNPNASAEREFVSEVRISDDTKPGAYTLRDYDLRRPSYVLDGVADKASPPEDRLEQYAYRPGGFVVRGQRYDDEEGRRRAIRSLASEREGKRVVQYRTNVLDLWPGQVFAMAGHPHPDLSESQHLLVTDLSIEGAPGEEWTLRGRAVFANLPYRPPLRTPRPRARLQSATVFGDGGVLTDEFGRVVADPQTASCEDRELA